MKITSKEIDRAFAAVRDAGLTPETFEQAEITFRDTFRAMLSGSQVPQYLRVLIESLSINPGVGLTDAIASALVVGFLAGRKSMENEEEK